MLPRADQSNLVAVAEPPETQTRTPATTKASPDIQINCKIWFCDDTQKLRVCICPAIYRSLPPPAPGGCAGVSAHINVHILVFAMCCVSLVRLWLLMILVANAS
jgi:hypothetical protein